MTYLVRASMDNGGKRSWLLLSDGPPSATETVAAVYDRWLAAARRKHARTASILGNPAKTKGKCAALRSSAPWGLGEDIVALREQLDAHGFFVKDLVLAIRTDLGVSRTWLVRCVAFHRRFSREQVDELEAAGYRWDSCSLLADIGGLSKGVSVTPDDPVVRGVYEWLLAGPKKSRQEIASRIKVVRAGVRASKAASAEEAT